jgi:hypothetical protein
MIYQIMTGVNVFLAFLAGLAVFTFLQLKTNDIRDISERSRLAKEIHSGDIYEMRVAGNALKPGVVYRYEVVDSKDGYVSYRMVEYPNSEPRVELATEFLKYKVKIEP